MNVCSTVHIYIYTYNHYFETYCQNLCLSTSWILCVCWSLHTISLIQFRHRIIIYKYFTHISITKVNDLSCHCCIKFTICLPVTKWKYINKVSTFQCTHMRASGREWLRKCVILNMKMNRREIVWMRPRVSEWLGEWEYFGEWMSHKVNVFVIKTNGLTVYCRIHTVTKYVYIPPFQVPFVLPCLASAPCMVIKPLISWLIFYFICYLILLIIVWQTFFVSFLSWKKSTHSSDTVANYF